MSFYGSVYYQLIDTFYKAVLRNKGKNKNTFVNINTIPDEFESKAVGRKGVFGFDSGNKWINLNVVSEEKPDSNELYSIYEIYHGAPDAAARHQANGFKVRLDDSALNARIDESGVIQLNYFDEFETSENRYDDAGHISSTEKKIYRLPKPEVNDRVTKLEQLVGLPDDKRNDTDDKTAEGIPLENLYNYVEENYDDITTLENYVGDWSKVVSMWSSGGKWAPTIANTIGNLESMYESAVDRYSNHKTFAEIIGKLSVLANKINDGNFISLIDAIKKESDRLDSLGVTVETNRQSAADAAIGLNALIGEPLDRNSVYDHIEDIYEDIENIENILNWSERTTTTVSGELDSLDGRVDDLEQYRTNLDNVTLPAINRSIEVLDKHTSEHYEAWEAAEVEFRAAHNDIYTKIGTVPENKNIMGIVEDFRTTVNSTFGTVPEGSNIMSEIKSVENKALDLIGTVPKDSDVMSELSSTKNSLLDLIGTVPEDSDIISELDSTKNNLLDLIGEVPENSDVMSELNSSFESLTDLIGEIPEESSVSAELASIQQEVDNLENIIGAVPEGNTVYGLISTNAGDITEIKEHMGDKVDGKTLSARISENASNMSTLVTTTLPTNYVSKTELTSANYATIGDVEKVETALTAVVGDLANIEVLKENATNSEVALLQDIFDRLVVLEADIKSIKDTLNPPIDDPESGGEDPDNSGTEPEPNPEEGTE